MKKRRKIVLLLGAGFPIAWDAPCSKKILDKILEDTNFMFDENQSWGSYLYDNIKLFYKESDGNTTVNFETVIAALEIILNHIIASTNEGGNAINTSLIPAILSLKDPIQNRIKKEGCETNQREYVFGIYCRFVSIVLNSIKSYDDNVCNSEYKELNSKINDFILYWNNKKYSVKIYTTNYDTIIPQILNLRKRKVYTGEKRQKGDVVYVPNYNRNKDSHLCFFYLHGSIYWKYKYREKYDVVKSEGIIGEVTPLFTDGGNPNEPLFFSPIIAGYTKTQRSLSHPFNMGFVNFANDCNDCNKLLTVGYSFSDPHINSVIQSNIDFNRVRLINVGLFKNLFKGSSEYIRINTFIRPIDENEKKKENDEWFYGQQNNIVVFKKGTKDFFCNKTNWKEM